MTEHRSVPPTAQVSLEYGPPISLELAKRMLEAAETEAQRNGWPMAITIVDSAARIVAFYRMDNAQNGSIDNARWKAETAVNYRCSTKAFEDAVAGRRNRPACARPTEYHGRRRRTANRRRWQGDRRDRRIGYA
jgi:uncharacterized protein GlcG (DUF336 family)